MNTCCKLCGYFVGDNSPACSILACPCHQEKPTHEIEGWEKRRKIAWRGALWEILDRVIERELFEQNFEDMWNDAKKAQKESIVSKLEEKVTDSNTVYSQGYNQAITDAIEVVRGIDL